MLVDDDKALRKIFQVSKMPVMVHCEDSQIINDNMKACKEKNGEDPDIKFHPLIRSEEACVASTTKAVELAKEYGTRLHVAHISTERELALFSPEHPNITAEICVPHLLFCDEDYARLGARIKCNPAVKTKADLNAVGRQRPRSVRAQQHEVGFIAFAQEAAQFDIKEAGWGVAHEFNEARHWKYALVNWIYFFHAWGMPPRFATVTQVHDCPGCRGAWQAQFPESDQAQAREGIKLYAEAQQMLRTLSSKNCRINSIVGLFPAWSDGDDVMVAANPDGTTPRRLCFLRQQQVLQKNAPYLCLADFISPHRPPSDADIHVLPIGNVIGLFATAAEISMEHLYDHDDFKRLLVQTLSDRLAEGHHREAGRGVLHSRKVAPGKGNCSPSRSHFWCLRPCWPCCSG